MEANHCCLINVKNPLKSKIIRNIGRDGAQCQIGEKTIYFNVGGLMAVVIIIVMIKIIIIIIIIIMKRQ